MDFLNVEDAKDALERIQTKIDWKPLCKRCQRRLGWSTEYSRHILQQYQRYLALKVATEDWEATILFDAMWHEHILDTKRYAQDCDMIMKDRFFHHDADGDVDVAARQERVRMTHFVHYSLFYEEYPLSAVTRDLWEDFGNTESEKHTNTGAPTVSNDDNNDRILSSPTSTMTELTTVSPEPSSSSESAEPSGDEDNSLSEDEQGGSSKEGCESVEGSREGPEDDEQHQIESSLPVNNLVDSIKPNAITISVNDRTGAQTFYRLKRTTRMKNVFKNYARLKGANLNRLMFSINNRAIAANDTPEMLQLVEGVTIDCDGVPVTPPRLILRVREPSGLETHFQIKSTTRMRRIFAVMAQRMGVPAWRLTFFYRRIRIGQTDTAESLQMSDQDYIDCRLDLLGC
uniref:Ubiquitin-like domain-containing protein n=1 Tax=Amphora coffeiformis TaxID=265554 RepID=A0A7S3P525_9STRA|eukprot:scaffold1424_cov168-Amphora_coffeaeformis.AAC.14